MLFLHPYVPQDIANYTLSFLGQTSIKALRAVNKQHQQFIESSPHFLGIDERTRRATDEIFEKKATLKKISNTQCKFEQLLNNPFKFIYKFFETTLLLPYKKHLLTKELSEIESDFPISHLFGTKEEFNLLPVVNGAEDSRAIYVDELPSPIVRCWLRKWDDDSSRAFPLVSEKPALMIRVMEDNYTQGGLTFCVYSSREKQWMISPGSYDVWSGDFSFSEARPLIENGKNTIDYYRLRQLIINKKFSEIDFSGIKRTYVVK